MSNKSALARRQRIELRSAGYMPGETAGNACCDCGANCGRGWWQKVNYEYNEWECWCRDCAYIRLHQYDDFDFDEWMHICESAGNKGSGELMPNDLNELLYCVSDESLQQKLLERIKAIVTERDSLRQAIVDAIDYANGRESEWGERAETCFAILNRSIN